LRRAVAGWGKTTRGLALGLGVAFGWSAVAATYSEDAVKAAYLHRFAAYVYWPSQTSSTPFVIGVFGNEAVAAELARLLPQLTAEARPAIVRKLAPGQKPEPMHVLYIGPGRLAEARDLLLALERQPVLVVTDDENGLARGGTINFVRVGRNLKFEVSLKAARLSGLQISSGLLSVAARVEHDAGDPAG
jgi:hypothetical protein